MTGRMTVAAMLLAGTALAATGAQAQSTGAPGSALSTITPDGSTRTAIQGSEGGTIVIGGGTIAGDNLFHSFAQFDLGAGETAAWAGPGSIANVINRVTGSAASHIDGTIDTTAMPLADFWFINPNGVLFGQGAAFNVPGAMHFSTATNLYFKDGAVFSAKTANGSTLSLAAPATFGFVGGEADIAMNGVGRGTGEGFARSLSLVAPGISVTDSSLNLEHAGFLASGTDHFVTADNNGFNGTSGRLTISNSSLLLRGGADIVRVTSLFGGAVTVTGSTITTTTDATPGEQIYLLATGTLVLDDSRIESETFGTGDGGLIFALSDGNATVSNSVVRASTTSSGAGGTGGQIRIGSLFGNLAVRNSNISSSTSGGGTTPNIFLDAIGRVDIADSTLRMDTLNPQSTGSAGSLVIRSGGDTAVSGTTIEADTFSLGKAGGIFFETGGNLSLASSNLTSTTYKAEQGGAGGYIGVRASGAATITGTLIQADTRGSGVGGNVNILANSNLDISGSVISADTVNGTGSGGYVSVDSGGRLTLSNANIFADTYGAGRAGNVFVRSIGAMRIADGYISSESRSGAIDAGNGGQVSIQSSATLDIADDALISTSTYGRGTGGNIIISAASALQVAGSRIVADTRESTGFGGSIFLSSSGLLRLDDARVFADTYAGGHAGLVDVRATGPIAITNSYVSSESRMTGAADAGNGGAVTIAGNGDITIAGNSLISTFTLGEGDAGYLSITAGGALDISGDSAIISDTQAGGTGGVITVTADELTLTNARIGANTQGSGQSLDVLVNARIISVGTGGLVTSASSGPGQAGVVLIGDVRTDSGTAELVRVVDGGTITANSTGTGSAGSVLIQADRVEVLRGGEITTSSSNANPAGGIVVEAGNLIVDGLGPADQPSRIISENVFSGTAAGGSNYGGDVIIVTRAATISNGGQLNTSSNTGNAGFIGIDFGASAGILRLLGGSARGTIRTDSGTGSGGQIAITGPYAIIADGSEISASGDVSNAFVTIDSATVRINSTDNTNIVNVSGIASVAPEQDVGSSTTVNEVQFLDAAKVLEGRCAAARSQGRASRLNVPDLGPFSLTLREDDAFRRVAAIPGGRTCL